MQSPVMSINRHRLDRLLSKSLKIKKADIRLLVARNKVLVDGITAKSVDLPVDTFSHIVVNGEVVQSNQPVFIVMNKPCGVVSATSDPEHITVLDLIALENKHDLHIVGRLDKNTSGLLLLTNDSRFSDLVQHPDAKLPKTYTVGLANSVDNQHEYIAAFEKGFYFDYEGVYTQPAKLAFIDSVTAQVELTEGKYHQIKRMFGRFRNAVLSLHRDSIGELILPCSLSPGEYMEVTEEDIYQMVGIKKAPMG